MVFAPPQKPQPPARMGFRLRRELADYISKRSVKDDRGEPAHGELTRVAEEAIELHKVIYERLAPREADLKKLAAAEGLEWPRQFNELLILLVEKSLPKKK